ncbi:endospore germination permease [Paenibacillus sp. NEAU-GSW1]|uniref:GerAB/ArcD/ProY family transporter n=1 Tax=Paenibacillus sp. NEAU-GSW1 TaxID=2682486 RepID=UPI0012E25E3C|nr:endospore germination permease [Paenibacillus sp. NEAU-GSW1]MUT66295.1 endospore germination permease [Paenibacillus sp. NEAU-GSW1]
MQKIGKNQLAFMIVLFMIGSTPLFELGIKAKQDAWMAMTLAAIAGMLMTAVYVLLHRRAPEFDLAELYHIHFGRIVGAIASSITAIWFAYESMRNVRDFGELTMLALLAFTPKWIVMLSIMTVSYYTVGKGIEVFFRVVQMLFPIAIFSYAVIIVLLFTARLTDFHQLFPMLENGLGPVFKAAFPDLIAFPFGQMVIFLVFWKHVQEKNRLIRKTFGPLTFVSLFLIAMNILIMTVLGPTLASVTSLPLLEAVQLIRLANFLERLDILVTLLLYIGLYVKITLLYMASVFTISSAFGFTYRAVVLPVGICIYLTSFLEPNNTYHLWIGLEVSLKIVPFFQVVFPLLMLMVGVRSKFRQQIASLK